MEHTKPNSNTNKRGYLPTILIGLMWFFAFFVVMAFIENIIEFFSVSLYGVEQWVALIKKLLNNALFIWGMVYLFPRAVRESRQSLSEGYRYYGGGSLFILLGFGVLVYVIKQWQPYWPESMIAMFGLYIAVILLKMAPIFYRIENEEQYAQAIWPLTLLILFVMLCAFFSHSA